MRQTGLLVVAIVSMLLCAPSAIAADPSVGWYVGANVGQSKASIDDGGINQTILSAGFTSVSTSKDETDTGGKVFVGFRFHPNFAVEAGYFNLGKVSFTSTTTPAATISGDAKSDNGFNIDLLGIMPVTPDLSLFARVGAQTSKTTLNATGSGGGRTVSASSSETGTNWKAGLGAQYNFTQTIGARAEWERYRLPGGGTGTSHADVDLFSLGLVVRF